MLAEYLGQDGFEVECCHDGEHGLQRALSGEFALMVLDVMMPGMSGVEVLNRVRARSRMPILMLTARGDDMDRVIGLELGADDYVPKPCTARELAARGNPPVALSYFGSGDPAAYGIRYVPLLMVANVERTGNAALTEGGPLYLAVSETNLVGTYFQDHALFSWLRSRAPAAVPGGTIYLYDLTADADARARLAALFAGLGRPGDARAAGLH